MPARPSVATVVLPGPWGPIHAAAGADGIVAIAFLATSEAFAADLGRIATIDDNDGVGPETRRSRDHLDLLAAELDAYFRGAGSTFTVPLDPRIASPWDRAVLGGVGRIPFGHVATYGDVAASIGRRGAARAVGGAVGRNPIALLIPCHRVIAAGGRIGGYGGDWYGSREERLAMKRDLLRLEGIVLADDPALSAA